MFKKFMRGIHRVIIVYLFLFLPLISFYLQKISFPFPYAFSILYFLSCFFKPICFPKQQSHLWLPSISTNNTPVSRQRWILRPSSSTSTSHSIFIFLHILYISFNLIFLSKSLGHLFEKRWLMTHIKPLESSHYLRTAGLTEIAKSHNYNNDGGKWRDICKKYWKN